MRYSVFVSVCLLLTIGTVFSSNWNTPTYTRQLLRRLPATCSQPPLLKNILASIRVTPLKSPVADSQSCKPEWSTYGTCCPVSKLNARVAEADAVYGQAFEIMDMFLEYLGNAVSSHLKEDSQALTTNTEINAITKTLEANHNSCVAYHKQYFGQGICKIYSGMSQRFVVNDQMPVQQSECKGLLKACSASWNDYIRILKAYKDYEQLAKRLSTKPLNPTNKVRNKKIG